MRLPITSSTLGNSLLKHPKMLMTPSLHIAKLNVTRWMTGSLRTDGIIWIDGTTNMCIANGIVVHKFSIFVGRVLHISESWDVYTINSSQQTMQGVVTLFGVSYLWLIDMLTLSKSG